MFIHINDAAPSRSALGTINGLAQTVATTCRIFAPIVASSLFSLSQQHHLLHGTMVYCVLGVFVLCGLLVSLRLPQKLDLEDG
jgi:Na+/melibiose symporter-like transporter